MSAAGNDGALSELDTSSSDERVDVHVLVVPMVAWRNDLRFAYSSVCLESASAGFVRVGVHTTLVSLREEIASQLSPSLLPGQYVFLRNLGRCFSWVSSKQEETMNVNLFIPPLTSSPEVYVLDGACFHGFPEGIVGTSRGADNYSRSSFPLGHNRSVPAAMSQLPTRSLNHMSSSSPHCPDQNLAAMRSHDPMRSHDVIRSHDPTRSHDALLLNSVSSNRKFAQQQLPNLLPRQQLQHQQAIPRQRAYTSDGTDLVQHRRGDNNQHSHSYTPNITTVHASNNNYASPIKTGSNNDSNSLSNHSYTIDELHQESEVLPTSYGPSWQSSATQSLVVPDSAANSLCSTALPSSLNGAHHSHSPAKSMLDSPHEASSSGSKMLGPRVNVDLNLADSVIAENTEVLERALFGSRGDGEGSSLTNSLLNITGATSGHYLQQNSQSQLQDYNHVQLPSGQLHPHLALHHTGNVNHQNAESYGYHGNIAHTLSPSNHITNENTGMIAMVTSTPRDYNRGIPTRTGNASTLNNDQLPPQTYSDDIHSATVEQFHNVNMQHGSNQGNSMSHETATSNVDVKSATDDNPIDNTSAINAVANVNTSNILTGSNGQLLPVVRAVHSNGESIDNSEVITSECQSIVYNTSNRNELLKQDSVFSDAVAMRSSVEGDGCSQSRADITASVNNVVAASHDLVEHRVTITDGGHQIEHSSQLVISNGQSTEKSEANESSSQHLIPGSQQPSLKTSTLSEDGADEVMNQQSPLCQREAGVGTSMFSTSPLPPITVSPDKNDSTSEVAGGKPAELDEVNQLLAQLRMARDDRRTLENTKRGLSDTVKTQQKAKRAAQDREDKKWKKMYFQEKKATQVNEDRLRRLRNEVHQRIGPMATNCQDTPTRGVHQILSPITVSEGPSEALNVKIQCARVEQDLTKLRQKLLAAQEKLKIEREARIMAEAENKTIRKNVLQQKINCTLTRTI